MIHEGCHDDCDECDAILEQRANDPDEMFIDADEFFAMTSEEREELLGVI